MAGAVDVKINGPGIISALNTPGGGVYEWRDKVGEEIWREAISTSPVNEIDNAIHRDGVVGTYKRAWKWDRRGSNQHRVRARVFNTADHAAIVEYGRRASTKEQTFSWTEWHGGIQTVGRTKARRGQKVLIHATNRVMAGVATPLS